MITLEEINHNLATLINCTDPTFANAAKYVAEVSEAANAGNMSADELTEILEDVKRQLSIIEDMNQLRYKEILNVCIESLITIAKML